MHRKLAAVTIDEQSNGRRLSTAAAGASSSSARVVGSRLSGLESGGGHFYGDFSFHRSLI